MDYSQFTIKDVPKFRALSNPGRLKMVLYLHAHKENVSVTDLINHTKQAQSLVSHNLKKLVAAEIVKKKRCGTFQYISLA